MFFANTRDNEGNEIALEGESLEALAKELATHNVDAAVSLRVTDDQRFTRGWIHGDGGWKAQ